MRIKKEEKSWKSTEENRKEGREEQKKVNH
jgi:hypothetical protein